MDQIYKGENGLEFCKKNEIGKGGNGKVFDIKLINKKYPFDLVAKFFNYSGVHVKERYIRFRREIISMCEMQKDIDGVMKVIDYHLPEDYSKNDAAWYIMQKAEKFNCKDFYEIIYHFLDLAKIIKAIHTKGMYHRDIKPENIMVIDKKIYLCDFGLILFDDSERLTGKNENIGPFFIAPPEYDHLYNIKPEDQQFFDVYLFAKTMWLYLKNEKRGFTGEYDISDDEIRIEEDNVSSIYPINHLLEQATKNNYKERIKIDRCIELLEEQININNKKMGESITNEYNLYEKTKIVLNKISSDYSIYSNQDKIYSILTSIVEYSSIKVLRYIDNKIVHLLRVSRISKENELTVLIATNGSMRVKYITKIKELKYIDGLKIEVYLNKLSDEELSGYVPIEKNIYNNKNNISIDNDYYLLIDLPALG